MEAFKKKFFLLSGCLIFILMGLQACNNNPPVLGSKPLVISTGPTYTPTATFTPCSGVFGTNVVEPASVVGSTFIWFNPYVPSGNKTLLSLSTYSASASPVTYELGIYNANGTGALPATLLSETGPQTIGPATLWSKAPLTSSVNLSSGVTYWLALHSTVSNYLSGGISYAYQTVPASYGSLPMTFSGISDAVFTFSLYGTTCP